MAVAKNDEYIHSLFSETRRRRRHRTSGQKW